MILSFFLGLAIGAFCATLHYKIAWHGQLMQAKEDYERLVLAADMREAALREMGIRPMSPEEIEIYKALAFGAKSKGGPDE